MCWESKSLSSEKRRETNRQRERGRDRIFCHYGYWQIRILISECHVILSQGSVVAALSGLLP